MSLVIISTTNLLVVEGKIDEQKGGGKARQLSTGRTRSRT